MSDSDVEQTRDSEQRIRRIVDRARHETGLRDLVTFCVARIWSVLLILGAVCSAWYASSGKHPPSPNANTDSHG